MVKRVITLGAILVALSALLTLNVSTTTNVSLAAPANLPNRQTALGPRFLTLPFADPRVTVSQGWIYDWGVQHSGIDFMLGDRNTTNWLSYDVYASADGWACGNCTSRQGNAVWIKHVVEGQIIYTYYGHLDTIEDDIPLGSQQRTVWVQRGQKIGVSGSTGADVIHLHFGVYSASSQPMDPYDLWTMRGPYAPGCIQTQCRMGTNSMWTTNPPTLASGEVPPPPPPPAESSPTATRVRPTNTPVRFTNTPAPPTLTPTPTKPPCELKYGQTVAGNLSGAVSEVRYCLTAQAGDWTAVRMFAAQGSPLDAYIKVFAPDGTLVASDDDGAQIDSNSFLVKQLPQSGIYQVVATRYSGSGAYKLRVEKGMKSALGDLNGDCVVNQVDIQLMSVALANRDTSADLNLDGSSDILDQTIQLYRLGRGCMQIR